MAHVPPPAKDRGNWIKRLDSRIRWADWRFNRTAGGWISCIPGFETQPPLVVILFACLVPFLVYGPSLSGWMFLTWSLGTAASYCLVVAVAAIVARKLFGLAVLGFQLPLAVQIGATTGLFVFRFAIPVHDYVKEKVVPNPAPNIVLPAETVLYGMILVAIPFAWVILRRFQRNCRALNSPQANPPYPLLSNTELFVVTDRRPPLPFVSVIQSMFTSLLHNPLEVLLPPAACALVFGISEPLGYWILGGVTFVSLFLVSAGEVYDRIAIIRAALRRSFLYGGTWLTTVAVIALAIAWLARFDYVTTVLEADGWMVFKMIAACYVTFWVFEYWINRILNERLLALVSSAAGATDRPTFVSCVPYDYRPTPDADPQQMLADTPKVRRAGQQLQIHGAARLVTVGRRLVSGLDVWEFYERTDLIRKIAESAWNQGLPGAPDEKEARYLDKTCNTYFVVLNTVVAALFIALNVWLYHNDRIPELTIPDLMAKGEPPPRWDLRAKLFDPVAAENQKSPDGSTATQQPAAGPKQIVLVAASGGGTRAALFTASLLHGLHRKGALADVQLASGVSGGGAALAYFAAHREALLDCGDAGESAWRTFHHTMADPFIGDVLAHSSEFRIAYDSSFGILLAESFARRFRKNGDRSARTFGDIRVGLMLNTTVAGDWPRSFGPPALRPPAGGPVSESAYSGIFSGTRLMFTNLSDASPFPSKGLASSETDSLRFVVVQSHDVPLTTAAALNANFPPVFRNALVVDNTPTDGSRRYWVSDGGALENRGDIALLYALRGAIAQEQARRSEQANGNPQGNPPATALPALPVIHVVVVEASGGGVKYNPFPGAPALSQGAGKLANQLANELWADVRRLYEELHPGNRALADEKLRMHFIPMPSVLRFDGGLGTNWTLPTSVRIDPALTKKHIGQPSVDLTRDEIRQLIDELHLPPEGEVAVCGPHVASAAKPPAGQNPTTPTNVETVGKWIRDDALISHLQRWSDLWKSLR